MRETREVSFIMCLHAVTSLWILIIFSTLYPFVFSPLQVDCDYEEISSTLYHPDYSLVFPAFAEHDDSVYALAQLPSSPSDEINYSSITFTTTHHSDRTSDGQETCDYTTVRP